MGIVKEVFAKTETAGGLIDQDMEKLYKSGDKATRAAMLWNLETGLMKKMFYCHSKESPTGVKLIRSKSEPVLPVKKESYIQRMKRMKTMQARKSGLPAMPPAKL